MEYETEVGCGVGVQQAGQVEDCGGRGRGGGHETNRKCVGEMIEKHGFKK